MPKFSQGQRVEAIADHMGTKGKRGTVKIVRTTPAYYGVMLDGEHEVHKWLAEDELRSSTGGSSDAGELERTLRALTSKP